MPMIWVPNQLVGAPAGTDVTIECHTEAYPRAISYWVYDSVMLLSTKKYVTSSVENSYRTAMKLTIRNLRDRDFGNYRCIAKNSLGETEGSIRLYEIPMPSVPPKATEIRSGASKEERLVARNNSRTAEEQNAASAAGAADKRGGDLTQPPLEVPQPPPPPVVGVPQGNEGSGVATIWCGQPRLVLAGATAVLLLAERRVVPGVN
ncbi:hypothetical protein B566_EDAN004140 [Ephemera danica]|nr:hypothetical protein B566_EDAN004140 [Ephemera danica]